MARPKGSKSENKITLSQINAAKVMYIEGKSIPDIGKELGINSLNILYRYCKKEQWNELRDKFLNRLNETKLDNIFSAALEETNDILSQLKTIRDAAIQAVDTKSVEPVKFSEASSAYIQATDMTMKIKAEALQLSFITEVGKILRNRIRDKQLLIEISQDLRELFKKNQKVSFNVPEIKQLNAGK